MFRLTFEPSLRVADAAVEVEIVAVGHAALVQPLPKEPTRQLHLGRFKLRTQEVKYAVNQILYVGGQLGESGLQIIKHEGALICSEARVHVDNTARAGINVAATDVSMANLYAYSP